MYDNHYHNWYHVFDVMQTLFVLSRRTGVLARLSAWERFAHFRDTLLEKHHTLRAFEVMVSDATGLLEGISSAQYWEFRNVVSGCILATDFSRHGEYCTAAAQVAASGEPMPKQLEMELLIKAADISNVLKPFPIARLWALRITEEFFTQGDLEKQIHIDVTPMCDRTARSRVKLQCDFIDHSCLPFFTKLAAVYPALAHSVAQMLANRAQWERCSDSDLLGAAPHHIMATVPPSLEEDPEDWTRGCHPEVFGGGSTLDRPRSKIAAMILLPPGLAAPLQRASVQEMDGLRLDTMRLEG